MRFEETITRPVYDPKDWPEITGAFGVTGDLVDGRHVIGRTHTMTVEEVERWAKWQANKDKKPIRWRVFRPGIFIIACGIEEPDKES